MEFSSKRREMLWIFNTNMAAMTSRVNQQFITNQYKTNIKYQKICHSVNPNCVDLTIGLENVLTSSSSNQQASTSIKLHRRIVSGSLSLHLRAVFGNQKIPIVQFDRTHSTGCWPSSQPLEGTVTCDKKFFLDLTFIKE